jgi:hypothetical protein
VLQGELGRVIGAVAAFEMGNIAATLLILHATELLTRAMAPTAPPSSRSRCTPPTTSPPP